MKYRVGAGSAGRIIYEQRGESSALTDRIIGMMDSEVLAKQAVIGLNIALDVLKGQPPQTREITTKPQRRESAF